MSEDEPSITWWGRDADCIQADGTHLVWEDTDGGGERSSERDKKHTWCAYEVAFTLKSADLSNICGQRWTQHVPTLQHMHAPTQQRKRNPSVLLHISAWEKHLEGFSKKPTSTQRDLPTFTDSTQHAQSYRELFNHIHSDSLGSFLMFFLFWTFFFFCSPVDLKQNWDQVSKCWLSLLIWRCLHQY